MNLQELIARTRILARDTVLQKPLVSDPEITMFLNDAVRQAAIRGRLIRDSSTVGVSVINYVTDTKVYRLHPSVFEIIGARLVRPNGLRGHALYLRSPEWMDRNMPHWREDPVRYRHDRMVVQNDTTLELVNDYEDGDEIWLDCYRTPIKLMSAPTDKPEIAEVHHEYLVQWALYRIFSIPDADFLNANIAKNAESEFTRYFGPMPDSDLRRSTREDEVQHNYPML